VAILEKPITLERYEEFYMSITLEDAVGVAHTITYGEKTYGNFPEYVGGGRKFRALWDGTDFRFMHRPDILGGARWREYKDELLYSLCDGSRDECYGISADDVHYDVEPTKYARLMPACKRKREPLAVTHEAPSPWGEENLSFATWGNMTLRGVECEVKLARISPRPEDFHASSFEKFHLVIAPVLKGDGKK